MTVQSDQQIERGMTLAADLPEVMPDEASERLQPVYEDIQRTLRVPLVNLIFRSLANYPDYLVPAWNQISPLARRRSFERSADALRAGALVAPPPSLPASELEQVDDMDTLRAFNDTIHYVLPKLLLVVTAWSVGEAGGETGAEEPGSDAEAMPRGVAEGTTKVAMVGPEEADVRVGELFEQIKERHGHPLVSSYYRGLGNWPGFLEVAWSAIAPRVGSRSYEARKRLLVARAHAAMQRLSRGQGLTDELPEHQREEVRAILAAFRLKFIPEMLIDVTWIKALLDGRKTATSSRFSV